MKMNCGNCRFALRNPEEEGMAWCRRRPPLTYLLRDDPEHGPTTGTAFPYVSLEFCWCGEHELNDFARKLS